MSEFKSYHPMVNFIYFVIVLGFNMMFMHPACLAVSLVCSFVYSIMINGKKAVKFNFLYVLPLAAFSALLNIAFNHEGATILTYLPGGNPLTLEALLYGLSASAMLISVILWFSCFNRIITSDKLMYLFGKIIPSLSLIFSMVLRFVPRFKVQIKAISNAQKCIGRDVSDGTVLKIAKNGIKILSAMITWSLENAVDTADSMRARGYGLPERTSFSNYRFSKRDYVTLGVLLILSVYIIVNAVLGWLEFSYYPYMQGTKITMKSAPIFLAYFLLCFLPIIIEIKEAYRWKLLQ